MLRTHTIAFLLAASSALIPAFTTTPTHAAQRTFVSASSGVDTNVAAGCSPLAPCRSFQAAMTATDPSGEVVVLDSGSYDAVSITKSITLIAPTGVYAGISVFPGSDGITIATQGVNVALRGLTISGQGGNNGIKVVADSTLTVENCDISNLKQAGIFVNGLTTFSINNTVARDNGTNGIVLGGGANGTITRSIISGKVNFGIAAGGSVARTLTRVAIADSTIDGNGNGVQVASNNVNAVAKISIRGSRVVRNSNYGLLAVYNGVDPFSNAGVSAKLSASNNLVSGNGIGIGALSARVTASGNTVTHNSVFGFQNAGLSINVLFESAFNNVLENNAAHTTGNIAFFARE